MIKKAEVGPRNTVETRQGGLSSPLFGNRIRLSCFGTRQGGLSFPSRKSNLLVLSRNKERRPFPCKQAFEFGEQFKVIDAYDEVNEINVNTLYSIYTLK